MAAHVIEMYLIDAPLCLISSTPLPPPLLLLPPPPTDFPLTQFHFYKLRNYESDLIDGSVSTLPSTAKYFIK